MHQFTFSDSLTYSERGERSRSKLSRRIPIGHSLFYLFCKINKTQKRERHREQKNQQETREMNKKRGGEGKRKALTNADMERKSVDEERDGEKGESGEGRMSVERKRRNGGCWKFGW